MATPSLQKQVYQFALGKIGKQVGTGECYDLPDRALGKAVAKSAPDFTQWKSKWAKVDYIWGKEIQLGKAQAGDILQFKNHAMVITLIKVITLTFPGGGLLEYFDEDKRTLKRGHHSAIVASHTGGVMRIFEQHVLRGTNTIQKTVGKAWIYTRNQTLPTRKSKETIKITQSWAKRVRSGFSKKKERDAVSKIAKMYMGKTYKAKVTTTTSVKVSGMIRAYTPVRR